MNKNKLLFKQRFSPNNKVIANHLMNNIKMIKAIINRKEYPRKDSK